METASDPEGNGLALEDAGNLGFPPSGITPVLRQIGNKSGAWSRRRGIKVLILFAQGHGKPERCDGFPPRFKRCSGGRTLRTCRRASGTGVFFQVVDDGNAGNGRNGTSGSQPYSSFMDNLLPEVEIQAPFPGGPAKHQIAAGSPMRQIAISPLLQEFAPE